MFPKFKFTTLTQGWFQRLGWGLSLISYRKLDRTTKTTFIIQIQNVILQNVFKFCILVVRADMCATILMF